MAPKRKRSVLRKRARLDFEAVMEGAAAANEPAALPDLGNFDRDMAMMTEYIPGVDADQLSPLPGGGAGYGIRVGSLRGLDAAIADAVAERGAINRTIHAIVLPTVPVNECQALKEASLAGSYYGIPFKMADGGLVVDAKLTQKDALMDARTLVFGADLSLSGDLLSFNGPVVPERRLGARTPQVRARAALGSQQWARDVEGARLELQQIVASARQQMMAIIARLEAVAF